MTNSSSILAWKIPWHGAWQATVHGITESDTTEQLSAGAHTHTHTHTHTNTSLLILNGSSYKQELLETFKLMI